MCVRGDGGGGGGGWVGVRVAYGEGSGWGFGWRENFLKTMAKVKSHGVKYDNFWKLIRDFKSAS